jgi:hypothetical protein
MVSLPNDKRKLSVSLCVFVRHFTSGNPRRREATNLASIVVNVLVRTSLWRNVGRVLGLDLASRWTLLEIFDLQSCVGHVGLVFDKHGVVVAISTLRVKQQRATRLASKFYSD